MNNILEVENLNISFNGHEIINDLSFSVQRDTTVAIVGPNGSGKTVLFKSLLGIINYNGLIKWDSDVKIGYVPQKMSIVSVFRITVCEFLNFKEKNEEKVNSVLLKVGFKVKTKHEHHDLRVLNTRMGNLSGGELQRILIAYALLDNPKVLLLDEPTAGVDMLGEKKFYDLFKSLKDEQDLTIIFISHDEEIVKKYADKIIKLNNDHE